MQYLFQLILIFIDLDQTAIASLTIVPIRGIITLLIGGWIFATCKLATLGLPRNHDPNKQPLAK